MKHKPRIAISGSAGVGKTTLAARLAELYEVPLVEELMRPLIESGVDLHDLTPTGLKALLLEHYEIAVASMHSAVESHGGFVSDRSPADFAAFWLHYGFGDDAETAAFFERTACDCEIVDFAFVLPWGAIPLVDDGVRLTDRWRQLLFQTVVEGVARRFFEHSRFAEVPGDVTEVEARIDWVGTLLNSAS